MTLGPRRIFRAAGNWLGGARKLARRVIAAGVPHSVFITCLFAAPEKGLESLPLEPKLGLHYLQDFRVGVQHASSCYSAKVTQ